MPRARKTVLLFAGLGMACGCTEVIEEEVAEVSAASALSVTQSSRIVRSSVGQDRGCLDPDQIAQEVAAEETVAMSPPSCVTKTAEGTSVLTEYAECTGPLGRATWNGGFTTTFDEVGCSGIVVDIVDDGTLEANGRPVRHEASGTAIFGETLDIGYDGRWEGETERGKAYVTNASIDASVDLADECLELSASASAATEDFEVGVDIAELAGCLGACPTAGMVTAYAQGKRREFGVTVIFDGSDVALAETDSGRQFYVELPCEPAPGA